MQAIEVAEYENAYFQQMLAGITNHLLGLMYSLDRNNRLNKNKYMVEQINKARVLMYEKMESTLSIQDIAEELGIGYSSFRKLFKEYTGVSPLSYFQDIKLQRAKELLRATQMSIKEIAYVLNFDSPDYFSTQFKKKQEKGLVILENNVSKNKGVLPDCKVHFSLIRLILLYLKKNIDMEGKKI